MWAVVDAYENGLTATQQLLVTNKAALDTAHGKVQVILEANLINGEQNMADLLTSLGYDAFEDLDSSQVQYEVADILINNKTYSFVDFGDVVAAYNTDSSTVDFDTYQDVLDAIDNAITEHGNLLLAVNNAKAADPTVLNDMKVALQAVATAVGYPFVVFDEQAQAVLNDTTNTSYTTIDQIVTLLGII